MTVLDRSGPAARVAMVATLSALRLVVQPADSA